VTHTYHTYNEIINQPQAWAQAIKVTRSLGAKITSLWNDHPQSQVIFSGCGSTYYLSLAAASLFGELNRQSAKAVPAGELYLYPQNNYVGREDTILVAISRSGTTSETIAATGKFKAEKRGPVVVITNYGETPLAKLGDVTITIPAGQEESVAQTRSFAAMYLATTALAAKVANREDLLETMTSLPECGDKLIAASEPLAKSIGENLDFDRFYFLGSGPRYGLACETNLKMKEMTLTHSEPFHFMEFRHGPMSMVTESAVILGLRSTVNQSHEQTVLEEMQALGGHVFSLSEANADFSFSSELPEEIRNVLYLPPLQLMAFYRSLAKGLIPDHPQNLTAVVELELI
jgi:glucosamine--fructose-6-phosphate aminotransferase (isomerizing)